MTLRSNLEIKSMFNTVRSGLFRTLKEADTYHANGFFPNASGLAPDNATGYDSEYKAGIYDAFD